MPRSLRNAARIAPLSGYPTRRARPQRITNATPPHTRTGLTLERARAQIRERVASHAHQKAGILELAHPRGTGKGHTTIAGL